jgi:hypothetical protein
MTLFWLCGVCETSNPAGIAMCDVCGVDRPALPLGEDGLIPDSDLDAFVRERHAVSRPISSVPSSALRSLTPVDRCATVAPPWVLVEYLLARRRVLHVVNAVSRGFLQLLRG